MIDLRSDTVSQPTAGMRRAMAEAPVGDDVYGDDPSVNLLEATVADLLGKDEAVLMPTGTMSNQVGIRIHLEPGDTIILAEGAHIFTSEGGGTAAISGAQIRLLPTDRGIYTAETLTAALWIRHPYVPQQLISPPRVASVENTSNAGSGRVWPIETIRAVAAVARQAGLKLHLDGARLWNASVASGVPLRDYAAFFDTVSVCFSKGLGAPIGSCLAGTRDQMARARRFRQQLGGGMRQAGIIAAAALYAVQHHRDRLADDHANARRLAEGIAGVRGIEFDPATVETNILRFRVTSIPVDEFSARLRERHVLMLPFGKDGIRAITHLGVSAAQIETAIAEIRSVLA